MLQGTGTGEKSAKTVCRSANPAYLGQPGRLGGAGGMRGALAPGPAAFCLAVGSAGTAQACLPLASLRCAGTVSGEGTVVDGSAAGERRLLWRKQRSDKFALVPPFRPAGFLEAPAAGPWHGG